jgi:hypothetical protein
MQIIRVLEKFAANNQAANLLAAGADFHEFALR